MKNYNKAIMIGMRVTRYNINNIFLIYELSISLDCLSIPYLDKVEGVHNTIAEVSQYICLTGYWPNNRSEKMNNIKLFK